MSYRVKRNELGKIIEFHAMTPSGNPDKWEIVDAINKQELNVDYIEESRDDRIRRIVREEIELAKLEVPVDER